MPKLAQFIPEIYNKIIKKVIRYFWGVIIFMWVLAYNMMCVACCVHLCVIEYVWKTRNTRVGKHNLRGSENNNEHEKFRKLN